KGKGKRETYNTRDSLVVTDPTTSLALTGLSMGERTGSRVFQWVWSYVLGRGPGLAYSPSCMQMGEVMFKGAGVCLFFFFFFFFFSITSSFKG
ncbi:hypothetical protein NEUTE1DRAFT_47219, partial [Neurospora tetrasperma FGSC 2508]